MQIGQKLLIDPGFVTPSPTPRPLTPIEKLTPEKDGKYYHVVQSGETLSWIAGLYEISLTDLMTWNGLDASSIIRPEQKLLLKVTPPASATPTPGPATATWTATAVPPTPTPSLTPTLATSKPPDPVNSTSENSTFFWLVSIGLAMGGLLLVVLFSRKKQ